jgi:hypothetical protein
MKPPEIISSLNFAYMAITQAIFELENVEHTDALNIIKNKLVKAKNAIDVCKMILSDNDEKYCKYCYKTVKTKIRI